MERVWLDTALLAIPNYAVSEILARDLFSRVTHYADLARSVSSLQIFISDFAEEDLWANNCGPEHSEIETFLQLMNLAHVYSANDLLMAYQTVLTRANGASDGGEIEVRSLEYFNCEPPISPEYGPVPLRQLTQRSFATVVGLLKTSKRWNLGSAIDCGPMQVFSVRVVVDKATGPIADRIGPLPLGIADDVRALRRCGDLVSEDQALRIWRSAESAGDLALAIGLYAFSLRKRGDGSAKISDLARFSIGSGFASSLHQHQCFGVGRYSSVTLLRCAHIVGRTGTVPVGPLGRPNQVKRLRDKALAFRVHLTGGGVALRLMYWDVGGHLEFANVGVKHALVIDVGSVPPAAVGDLSIAQ